MTHIQQSAIEQSARPAEPRRVLVARLDSAGDVLLAGPAVRAVAGSGAQVTMLCSNRGVAAARLLPGVSRVELFDAPWILADPAPLSARAIAGALLRLRRGRHDEALILTSFHQSALPLALMLRLAGVGRISAASEDYPGSLLDVRVRLPRLHESHRSAAIAEAAGFSPRGTHLELRPDLPDVCHLVPRGDFVVVHPGADAPARAWPAANARATVRALADAGTRVVVTGAADEQALTSFVADGHALDLGGRTDLAQLAAVVRRARALIVANSGPAHLACAVGTPAVSLFAPTVSVAGWGPRGVPNVVLGDQTASCAGSRARTCPTPGHPCLSQVGPHDVLEALTELIGVRA